MSELLAAPRDASYYAQPGRAEVRHIARRDGGMLLGECRRGRTYHDGALPLVEESAGPAAEVHPNGRCRRPGCRSRWPEYRPHP